MTTDPFVEAASDAAVASHDRELGPGFNGAYSGNYCIGFEQGAEWARTHLAAQEPTGVEVEAAAKAIYLFEADYRTEASWERETAAYRVHYLTYARAALSAARAARRDEEKRDG